MQFKYPELLWGLFLLVIPILIHLFQLRKFKKTPFTNVKLLQEVITESRKSNTLKKWLLLLTRLGIIATLVLAFAQPFFAKKEALATKETVIYVDNSFSMQAPLANGTILSNAIQDLLKEVPKDQKISLFTNNSVFTNVDIKEIQNDLLALDYSTNQIPLSAVLLKAKTLFTEEPSSIKNTIVVSDFQKSLASSTIDSLQNNNTYFVKQRAENLENSSIDSVYIAEEINENINIIAQLSGLREKESTAVSLYDGEKLIAKTSAIFNANKKASVTFSIPKNKEINGQIKIVDNGLKYDNHFYFNIAEKEKIKVLAIGKNNSFLQRIYTKEDFNFTSNSIKNLNYSILEKQHTILLNELTTIPNALITALHSFTQNGGALVVIPSLESNFDQYNTLISPYYSTVLKKTIRQERSIANISFAHPIYKNVFQRRVTNFLPPKVQSSYNIQTKAPVAISFANQTPFLIGNTSFYLFSAPLSKENSNFKSSPLIVPTFYNIAAFSLKTPLIYSTIGKTPTIELTTEIPKDHILKVEKENFSFIPRQETHTNKVSLFFKENPVEDGIYKIVSKEKKIQNLSFNYSREESNLEYLSLSSAKNTETSLHNLFTNLQKDNSINTLWKWFVIFTLLFILLEILFQKFLK